MGDFRERNRRKARRRAVKHQSRDYWRERICDALPGLNVDWLEDGPIRARLKARRFAEAEIVETIDPPLQVSRQMRPGEGDGGYKLVLHLAGHGRYRYAGHDRDQAPGDLVLLDTALPFEAVHPAGTHVLVWGLSREALAPMLERLDHRGSWHIRGSEGIGAVLGGYVRTLTKEADRLSAAAQNDLQTHLCALVALALGSPLVADQSRHMAQRAVQQQRILDYIETHLCNPLLTAERAAREMAMSRRWLHALLDESGESFSERLIRRRLEESQKLLCDRRHDRLSVAEIGFMAGFNDVSTFHRRFRRHYGVTPHNARRARLERPRSARSGDLETGC